ncbi:hypothetical protein AB6A40_004972 [Gnathostoma spinigerum]|uniref:Uncharacterized protein n=1 Tax=Gnathostoma spinigerum TaxID=75299 RepID=A0ABD6EE40_9BILA
MNATGVILVAHTTPGGRDTIRLSVNYEHTSESAMGAIWNTLRMLLDSWEDSENNGIVATESQCERFIGDYDKRVTGTPARTLTSKASRSLIEPKTEGERTSMSTNSKRTQDESKKSKDLVENGRKEDFEEEKGGQKMSKDLVAKNF